MAPRSRDPSSLLPLLHSLSICRMRLSKSRSIPSPPISCPGSGPQQVSNPTALARIPTHTPPPTLQCCRRDQAIGSVSIATRVQILLPLQLPLPTLDQLVEGNTPWSPPPQSPTVNSSHSGQRLRRNSMDISPTTPCKGTNPPGPQLIPPTLPPRGNSLADISLRNL
jgi:hypothetical protein